MHDPHKARRPCAHLSASRHCELEHMPPRLPMKQPFFHKRARDHNKAQKPAAGRETETRAPAAAAGRPAHREGGKPTEKQRRQAEQEKHKRQHNNGAGKAGEQEKTQTKTERRSGKGRRAKKDPKTGQISSCFSMFFLFILETFFNVCWVPFGTLLASFSVCGGRKTERVRCQMLLGKPHEFLSC